jgi:GT2 family glycosyltransferase
MNNLALDIIVPVWNRPIETRDCLVNLVNYSPNARFIMVDNGSDRETERLLQEFAERLDDRALLLRNDVNQGFVKALNRGLERGTAEYLAVVRSTSRVSAGWLEPLLEFARQRTDAGLILPRLVTAESRKSPAHGHPAAPQREVCSGSFAAMLIKRELYAEIGGFDEDMDGGLWCLKDYSRRACRAGFLTFSVLGGEVHYAEELLFGSPIRREETLQRTISLFRQRWGADESSFCLIMPKGADLAVLEQKLEVLLLGARQGNVFTVVPHAALYREMVKAGHASLHENIRVEPLPFFCTAARAHKILARLVAERPDTRVVAGIDGITFAGVENPLTFKELEERIRRVQC